MISQKTLVVLAVVILGAFLMFMSLSPSMRTKAERSKINKEKIGRLSSEVGLPIEVRQSLPRSVDTPLPKSDVLMPDLGSVSPSSASGPTSSYTELFDGLETKKWYYRDRNPVVKDRIQKKIQDEGLHPLDSRLTKLLDLKKRDLMSFRENSAYHQLRELYVNTNLIEVVYLNGVQLSRYDLANSPLDMPICIVKFNRDQGFKYISGHTSFFIENSEAIEFSPRIKGVRVSTLTDPEDKTAFWIQAFECYVHERDSAGESYTKLALIHLVATLGIDCDI